MLLTGCNGDDGITNYVPLVLKRLATAPLDAEFTGLYLNIDEHPVPECAAPQQQQHDD